jgi:ribosomal protein S18 acetylase RimI-like enzyme
MNVRPIESVDDLRAAYRINGRAWETAYGDFLPADLVERVATMPVEDELRDQFESVAEDCYLVAERDGDVVGYCYARWGDDTKDFVGENAAGLKELYVDPEYWDKGVGTELLAAAIERIPEKLAALELETLAENDVGRSFYEARGFEAVDEIVVELGDYEAPAVVYRREL